MHENETMGKPVFPQESVFTQNSRDCYGIYQVKSDAEYRKLRFASLAELQRTGQSVNKDHYDLVYTGNLPEKESRDTLQILEKLYVRFNLDHPEDFQGHSMSVSDVVVLKQKGRMTAWYTDSFGFEKLPDFVPENALKNAEMAMEDDYGMIDGIINNGSKQTEPPDLGDKSIKPKAKHRDSPER